MKNNNMPISKSQQRALALLGLSAATYDQAADVLAAAGYRKDGIPAMGTWRTAAKLADAELLAAITLPDDRFEDTSNDLYW